MVMLFYLDAIMAIDTFGANDPFPCGSSVGALVTLFRCSTLEDWSDVMYIAYYGCDKFDSQYVYEREWTKENRQFWCDHRNASPSPAVAVLFFVSFTIVAAFVLLSLFIGAITMSMSESMGRRRSTSRRWRADTSKRSGGRSGSGRRRRSSHRGSRAGKGAHVQHKNSTDAMGYMVREQMEEDEVVVKADAPLLVRRCTGQADRREGYKRV